MRSWGQFNFVINNLVVCIIDEGEVRSVLSNIQNSLAETGIAYVGFCNPRIFDVKESNIDLRYPTGDSYDDNHSYKKVKKEGYYEIIETHRPIAWYERVFASVGLRLVDTIYTPEYKFKGTKIKDFAIFKLVKA